MTPKGGGEPTGEVKGLIDSEFGGFEAFQKHFNAASAGVQGSGWGVLSWEPLAGKLLDPAGLRPPERARRRARSRSWSATSGSTPTTCSTRTAAPSGSTPSGT